MDSTMALNLTIEMWVLLIASIIWRNNIYGRLAGCIGLAIGGMILLQSDDPAGRCMGYMLISIAVIIAALPIIFDWRDVS